MCRRVPWSRPLSQRPARSVMFMASFMLSDAKLFANRSALFANECAERVLLAFGELHQTNIDLGLAGNARIVANATDPFDTPEQIVIRERINCVNSLSHWQIITESESIKEPRGRSRSQS